MNHFLLSTCLGLVVLLALTSAGPAKRTGAVHRISVHGRKVAPNTPEFQHRLDKKTEAIRRGMKPEHFAAAHAVLASTQNTGQIDWIGQIQLGTPAQSLSAAFNEYEEDVYVLASNATTTSQRNSIPADRSRFDLSASTSAQPIYQNFSGWDDSGWIVNDVLTLGSLQAAVDVGDADSIGSWSPILSDDSDISAVFGLALYNTNSSSLAYSKVSVLAQLVDVLDQPVYTILITDPGTAGTPASNDSSSIPSTPSIGQITIGALDTVNCESDYVLTPALNAYGDISVVGASIGSEEVNAGQYEYSYLYIDRYYPSSAVNASLFDAIVSATGAVYDNNTGEYNIDSAKLADAPALKINLDAKAQLVLSANDYTKVSDDGKIVLALRKIWDDYTFISLGSDLLKNFCVAKNFKEGLIGLSHVKSK